MVRGAVVRGEVGLRLGPEGWLFTSALVTHMFWGDVLKVCLHTEIQSNVMHCFHSLSGDWPRRLPQLCHMRRCNVHVPLFSSGCESLTVTAEWS